MTMVEALQKSISQFLQRWLGLPRSLSIDLYGQSTNPHFLFSGLVEEFKAASAGNLVKIGREWQVQEAVNRAKAWLRHKTLVERRWFRMRYEQRWWKNATARWSACKQGGPGPGREHVESCKITWAELWRAEPQRIKFLIQLIYDVLPSHANLHTWGLTDTPAWKLCQRRGTMAHILSSCLTCPL